MFKFEFRDSLRQISQRLADVRSNPEPMRSNDVGVLGNLERHEYLTVVTAGRTAEFNKPSVI
jgi:hypothetical protein